MGTCKHLSHTVLSCIVSCVPTSEQDSGVGRNFFSEGAKKPGAAGAEIETPKASKGRGMGRGLPPPQPTRGSGGAS